MIPLRSRPVLAMGAALAQRRIHTVVGNGSIRYLVNMSSGTPMSSLRPSSSTSPPLSHSQPLRHFAKAIKIQSTVTPPKRMDVVLPLDMTQSMYPYLIDEMAAKEYSEEEIDATRRVTALSTANTQQLLSAKLDQYRQRYRLHENDIGSVAIQAAALTERVENMRRHLRERNTDIHARRTMAQILAKRRKLLLYMRRHHWPEYRQVMTDFGINEQELLTYGQTNKSGQQKVRQMYKH